MRVMAVTGQSIEVCLSLRLSLIILDCVEWVLPLNAGAEYWHPLKVHHLIQAPILSPLPLRLLTEQRSSSALFL